MFIQDDEKNVNILLSVHSNSKEHCMIVTSLNDYKMIDYFPLPFQVRNICLHPNKKQVYLVQIPGTSRDSKG